MTEWMGAAMTAGRPKMAPAHALSCPLRATKDIKEIAFLTITFDMSHKDSLYKLGKQ